jgi:hypothetical protein
MTVGARGGCSHGTIACGDRGVGGRRGEEAVGRQEDDTGASEKVGGSYGELIGADRCGGTPELLFFRVFCESKQ